MAIFTGTVTKYAVIGQREQLADIIYDISPDETPLVSAAGKENVKGTTFEWQQDSLASADTGNAQLEGDDITSMTAPTSTTRVGNYCQISRKLLSISGTAEVTEKAGRKSEMNRLVAKKGRELKLDVEAICWQNIGGDAGSETTARKTATLGAHVKTNVDKAANGGNPTYTSGVPGAARTDGTARALTETIFKNVAELLYTNGGKLQDVYAGPKNKQNISKFTGVVTRNYDISGKPTATAVIAAVDVYVTDFGTLRIHVNRNQRTRDVWFVDWDYISIATLRPFVVENLAKTGDAEKKMLLQEWGLKVKHEAALGLAADLTDAVN